LLYFYFSLLNLNPKIIQDQFPLSLSKIDFSPQTLSNLDPSSDPFVKSRYARDNKSSSLIKNPYTVKEHVT